jgi:DNA-binding NtrC family response regulator
MRNQEKRKLKVLIVEDELDILTLFREYLSGQGHQVVSCYRNANDILRDFEKNKPDVCLIDYALPGNKSGIDAAIDIIGKYPSMPILFITGHESKKEDLLKHPMLQDKNIEFLVKPVRLHQLDIAVLDIVNKNRNESIL